jgi:PleD family two-component response regulator
MIHFRLLAGLAVSFLLGAILGWWLRHRRKGRVVDTDTLEAQNRELHAVRIELEMANAKLRQLTILDPLTGIANRRAFDEALVREVRRAQRDRRQLSLILCDIDGFKAFNDHYGHARGDEALRQVARVVALTFRRAGDLAARYGGEEFGVILPEEHLIMAADEALYSAKSAGRNRVALATGRTATTPKFGQAS